MGADSRHSGSQSESSPIYTVPESVWEVFRVAVGIPEGVIAEPKSVVVRPLRRSKSSGRRTAAKAADASAVGQRTKRSKKKGRA